MPVACDGPRDLIVERGPISLEGTKSFDRVCVRDGGTLVATNSLTLRAGILDVAPRGVIDALSWQPWDGGDLRADDTVIDLAGDVR